MTEPLIWAEGLDEVELELDELELLKAE